MSQKIREFNTACRTNFAKTTKPIFKWPIDPRELTFACARKNR